MCISGTGQYNYFHAFGRFVLTIINDSSDRFQQSIAQQKQEDKVSVVTSKKCIRKDNSCKDFPGICIALQATAAILLTGILSYLFFSSEIL